MSRIGIRCEKCGTLIEKELPWPTEKIVEKVVKEPCRCGMNYETRMSRQWATVVVFLGIAAALAGAYSCKTHNESQTRRIEALKDQYKISTFKNDAGQYVPYVVEKTQEEIRHDAEKARLENEKEEEKAHQDFLRKRIEALQKEVEILRKAEKQ